MCERGVVVVVRRKREMKRSSGGGRESVCVGMSEEMRRGA